MSAARRGGTGWMKRWREAEEKERGERKGGREAGRGWANNCWRRGACGRRGDTANPLVDITLYYS